MAFDMSLITRDRKKRRKPQAEPLSPHTLRRFSPFAQLNEEKLRRIANRTKCYHVDKRTVLLDIGDNSDDSLFLVKGNVLLEAADKRQRIIKHTDEQAKMPLSRLRPSRYRITTLTPVKFFKVRNSVVDQLVESDHSGIQVQYDPEPNQDNGQYLVEEVSLDEIDFSTQVIADIYKDSHRNVLRLLSWRPASLPITRKIMQEDDVHELLSTFMLDPILSLKLIRLAAQSVDNLYDDHNEYILLLAMSRGLDIEKSKRLAFMNLFAESCQPKSELLQNAFRNAWEQSIIVSAVAKRLATELKRPDIENAALAGLLHNMGEMTIISHIYETYKKISEPKLQDSVNSFSAEVNRIILTQWKVPPHIVQATSDANNWQYDTEDNQIHLTHIIIAAKAIAFATRKVATFATIPPLRKIPAIRKLHLTHPKKELNKILHQCAKKRLKEIREQFNLEE